MCGNDRNVDGAPAPMAPGQGGGDRSRPLPPPPEAYPDVAPPGGGSTRPLLIGVVVVLVALVIGIAAALSLGGGDGDDRADVEVDERRERAIDADRSEVNNDGTDGSATPEEIDGGAPVEGAPAVVAPPVVVTTTSRPPDALDELRAVASSQADRVRDLDGYWVPQIGSKQVGTVDDGITYDNAAILADFRGSQTNWGGSDALLFWSTDVGSFKHGGYWVTVIDAPSWDGEAALQWCRDQGLDSDHCYAKKILLNGPWEDTTLR